MRYTPDFHILSHHPPGTPKSFTKSNPVDGFIFAQGGTNPDCLPQHIVHVHYGNFIPFYGA